MESLIAALKATEKALLAPPKTPNERCWELFHAMGRFDQMELLDALDFSIFEDDSDRHSVFFVRRYVYMPNGRSHEREYEAGLTGDAAFDLAFELALDARFEEVCERLEVPCPDLFESMGFPGNTMAQLSGLSIRGAK